MEDGIFSLKSAFLSLVVSIYHFLLPNIGAWRGQQHGGQQQPLHHSISPVSTEPNNPNVEASGVATSQQDTQNGGDGAYYVERGEDRLGHHHGTFVLNMGDQEETNHMDSPRSLRIVSDEDVKDEMDNISDTLHGYDKADLHGYDKADLHGYDSKTNDEAFHVYDSKADEMWGPENCLDHGSSCSSLNKYSNHLLGRVGVAHSDHLLPYDTLDYDHEPGSTVESRSRRMQDFDSYGLRPGPYSPPGVGDAMYSTSVFTYTEHIGNTTSPLARQNLHQWGGTVPPTNSRLAWAGGAVVDEKVSGSEVQVRGKDMGGVPYIPDHTLAQLTVKELNKRVQNLAREEVIALKQRRRTLKNRGYAMSCRIRRYQHKELLENQVHDLQTQLKKVEEDLKIAVNQRNFYRTYYEKNSNNAGFHNNMERVQHVPINLEMLNNNNNNHEDFKRINGNDIKMLPIGSNGEEGGWTSQSYQSRFSPYSNPRDLSMQ